MPTFASALPAKARRHGYDLRRTPSDRPITGLVTSEDFYVVETHYWGGRTVPCEGANCKACESNSPTRAHVYLSLFEATTHDHVLFECTACAAVPLDEYRKAHHTLRGCLIKASRPKRIKNGRVEISAKPYDLTTIRLPKAPNIPKALCVIWQVAADAIRVDATTGVSPILTPEPDAFADMHGDNDNGNGRPHKFTQEELLQCRAKPE